MAIKILQFDARLFQTKESHGYKCYSAEASDLRLPPGKFPIGFRINGAIGQFEFDKYDGRGNATYVAPGTLNHAVIFND